MATSSRSQLAPGASSPCTSATGTPRQTIPARKFTIYKSKQLRHVVRDHLLDTIRQTIGREIVQRHDNVPTDPRKNDEEPPNFYKWQFSSDYPRFPDGGVSRWSVKDHEACIEALNQGWLSVGALHAPATEESISYEVGPVGSNVSTLSRARANPSVRSVDGTPSDGPLRSQAGCTFEDGQVPDDISNVIHAIRHEEFGELVSSLAAEVGDVHDLSSLQESCDNVEHLILQRVATLQGVNKLLETQLRSLSDVREDIVNHAKTMITKLEQTVKDQNSRYHQLELRYEGLQKEFISATDTITDLKHKIEHPIDEVAEARRLDDLDDLRTAIQDLRKKRDAQEEEHLAQLKRVREESMQKGFRQGEASITRRSGDGIIVADLTRQLRDMQSRHSVEIDRAKEQVTHLKQQIEEMRAKHLVEVARAREEGRREDEELAQLLDAHNVNYIGRKRREMRAIYLNWKNVPQNILPKSMMPEGITPSDRILLLLARLSRVEEDHHKATTLLKREIGRRNAQLPDSRRDLTLTSADVEKVLASFGDEAGGYFTAGMSSTPQSMTSHTARSRHELRRSELHPCKDKKRIGGSDSVFNASSPTGTQEKNVSSQSLSFESRSSSEDSEYVESNKPLCPYPTVREAPRGGSNHEPHRVIATNKQIIGNIEPKNPTALKRALRRSVPNPEFTSFGSPAQVYNLSMMPAGATHTTNGYPPKPTTLTIHEQIDRLPLPPKNLVPSSLQDFPMSFVTEFIRGENTTFAKCGQTVLDKQIVNWPELIKLNPETHPLCPSAGSNGALTFVDGQLKIGKVGKTYPTLLRENVGFYQYIGHYEVVDRIIMPVETWKACKMEQRTGVAEEILSKEWGANLLRTKGLCINGTDKEEKRINDILGFFERLEEPCLRICWTLLQFVSFEREDYKVLVDAMKQWRNEDENDGKDDSIALDSPQQRSSADDAKPDANNGIDKSDHRRYSIEDVQVATPGGFDDSHSLRAEMKVPGTNENYVKPANRAKVHTPTAAVALDSKISTIPKAPDSARSIIPSSTNETNDADAPEYISEAEDGRWRIHTHRTPRVVDLTTPGPTTTSAESQSNSTPIKRQYEEDMDLYGVSPPLQTQAINAQVNIARPPSRTLQEILASFSNSKRRKISKENDNGTGQAGHV